MSEHVSLENSVGGCRAHLDETAGSAGDTSDKSKADLRMFSYLLPPQLFTYVLVIFMEQELNQAKPVIAELFQARREEIKLLNESRRGHGSILQLRSDYICARRHVQQQSEDISRAETAEVYKSADDAALALVDIIKELDITVSSASPTEEFNSLIEKTYVCDRIHSLEYALKARYTTKSSHSQRKLDTSTATELESPLGCLPNVLDSRSAIVPIWVTRLASAGACITAGATIAVASPALGFAFSSYMLAAVARRRQSRARSTVENVDNSHSDSDLGESACCIEINESQPPTMNLSWDGVFLMNCSVDAPIAALTSNITALQEIPHSVTHFRNADIPSILSENNFDISVVSSLLEADGSSETKKKIEINALISEDIIAPGGAAAAEHAPLLSELSHRHSTTSSVLHNSIDEKSFAHGQANAHEVDADAARRRTDTCSSAIEAPLSPEYVSVKGGIVDYTIYMQQVLNSDEIAYNRISGRKSLRDSKAIANVDIASISHDLLNNDASKLDAVATNNSVLQSNAAVDVNPLEKEPLNAIPTIIYMEKVVEENLFCERCHILIGSDGLGAGTYQLRCQCFPHYPVIVHVSIPAAAKIEAYFSTSEVWCGPHELVITVYPNYFGIDSNCITPTIFFEPSGVDFGSLVEEGIQVQLPLYVSATKMDLDRAILDKHILVYTTTPAFVSNVNTDDKWVDWVLFSTTYPMCSLVNPIPGHILIQNGRLFEALYINIEICHFSGFSVRAAIGLFRSLFSEDWIAFCGIKRGDELIQSPNQYPVIYGYCRRVSLPNDVFQSYFMRAHHYSKLNPSCNFLFTDDGIVTPRKAIGWCLGPCNVIQDSYRMSHKCADIGRNYRTICDLQIKPGKTVSLDFEVDMETRPPSLEMISDRGRYSGESEPSSADVSFVFSPHSCVSTGIDSMQNSDDVHLMSMSSKISISTEHNNFGFGVIGSISSDELLLSNAEDLAGGTKPSTLLHKYSVNNLNSLHISPMFFEDINWEKAELIIGTVGATSRGVLQVTNGKRKYAVKLFKDDSEEIRKQFEQEAHIMRHIREEISFSKHSEVATSMRFLELVGVLSTDLLGHCIRSKAYGCCGALVSELGNAGSLHQLLTSDPSSYPSSVQYVPKLDFWRQNVMALAILLYEVLDGIMWLHSHGICHLDIKPQNIVLHVVHSSKRSTSCQITAKIIDFGTAVFTAEEKYSDTLSWLLSWKNSVPGTDGFNVDNCQFKKYFYANKHSLTEEDVAFLRYMDMYSLSKVITASVDTIDQNKVSLTSDGVTANVVSELNLVASNMSSFKTKMKFEECVSTHRNVLRSIIIDTNRSIIRDNRFHLYTLSDETIINVRCPLNEICVALPLVNCAENSDNGHQKCSAI